LPGHDAVPTRALDWRRRQADGPRRLRRSSSFPPIPAARRGGWAAHYANGDGLSHATPRRENRPPDGGRRAMNDARPPISKPSAKARLTFTLELRPEPGVDPVLALRALLKITLRRFGMRAIDVRENLKEEQ